MTAIETDYLVVGAGAVGLAFADALLEHSNADITIVDRHGKPGGHWNDAYPFVTLHQPSAFYGVNSVPLGAGRKDAIGVNSGLYELASGHEVSGYFDRVMHQRLLPSGRVRYLPMAEFTAPGRCTSLLSGQELAIKVRRKTVDATYYGTSVPSTHKPKFRVAEGVRVVPPNALADLWKDPARTPRKFVILGAGKTGMDAAIWLLKSGADPAAISWVVPRDSWLLNRRTTQPGLEFFNDVFGGQVAQMRALAQSTTAVEVFERLEADGVMLRIDPRETPGMFHFATMSIGEVEVLRQLTQVIRMGRVVAIEPEALVLERGRVAYPAQTLYIDCTATAVEKRPLVPIFQGDRIVLQLVRAPAPTFSAALVAFVEATYGDDAQKNPLCAPVPFCDTLEQFPQTSLAKMTNQFRWSQDKVLRTWIRDSRLDGFGKIVSEIKPDDAEKQAVLMELRTQSMKALANIPRLARN